MRITCLVNVLTSVNSFSYHNHIALFAATKKLRPDWEIVFFSPNRMSIDNARNEAARMAMETNSDYLMFLDDDVFAPTDAIIKLVESAKDVVAGNVIIRGFPFNVMLFKWIDGIPLNEKGFKGLTYYNDLPLKGGGTINDENYDNDFSKLVELVPVAAVGFSLCLIKVSLLKKVPEPYFITGRYNTEDVYFCLRALETAQMRGEPAPSIYANTHIACSHLLTAEPINWKNRRGKLYEYYKEISDEQGGPQGRKKHYIENMVKQLQLRSL